MKNDDKKYQEWKAKNLQEIKAYLILNTLDMNEYFNGLLDMAYVLGTCEGTRLSLESIDKKLKELICRTGN